MSHEFVRYSPEIETIDPHLAELLPQIVAFWEKKVLQSPTTEGTGRAVRGAHAKAFGSSRQKSRSRATWRRPMRRASTPSRAATAP